jgi:hypothetical protein
MSKKQIRLDNLDQTSKERFRAGDKQFIKKTVKEEANLVMQDLVYYPVEKVGELRGRAQVLLLLNQLLGE